MEKLGIFTLSSQVFNGNQKVGRRKNPPQKKKRYPPLYPRVRDRSYDYARRLKDMETERSLKEMGISRKAFGNFDRGKGVPGNFPIAVNVGLPRGRYVENACTLESELEYQNLEGNRRIYDERDVWYGENVLEARQNPTWSCPACRGMIQLSSTYLILTRRAGATPKELNDGAEVVDLTAEEIAAAPHDEGSDYSAEWSGAESDDSDSEDETKGDKNNEEQPDKNDEEQLDENQVASAEKSIDAAVATDRDEVL
uniref:Zinc-finger domain-containing protein n=1 Tax=Chenopodium quinoa TaxID=63459 RepID=A0A803LPM8_CHEQI